MIKKERIELGTNNNKKQKITTALLMAAGMGTRIRPLSEETPKPLIPVRGVPMIETLIQAIKLAGIEKIIITVGYKKEKYFYLKDKYSNITFIENHEYTLKNTISSFYAAMNYLKNENCIICESDLYISDPSIIKDETDKSRYLIKHVKPQNFEWGFQIVNDRVKKVIRPNPDIFLDHHMYGIAYWMNEDLRKLIIATNEAYRVKGHEQKAYDEIGNEIFDGIDMGVIKVKEGQLCEIDCLDDLVKVDPSYMTYLSV